MVHRSINQSEVPGYFLSQVLIKWVKLIFNFGVNLTLNTSLFQSSLLD